MTDQRIKLAEFVGWRHSTVIHDSPRVTWWTNGEVDRTSLSATVPPFNPRNDANDCEALIAKLGECGWHYEERRQPTSHFEVAGVWLHIWHHDSEIHYCWDGSLELRQHRVCDLAEKVIDE